MESNETIIAAERGRTMRRTHLIAALLGIVALGVFAADASAMYHPGMGRFLQRDPGAGSAMRIGVGGAAPVGRFVPRDPTGTNQYADGMNVYQYVRSNPITHVDPDGLWGRETHWGDPVQKRVQGTYDIALDIGFSDRCARVLADWNQGVDDVTPAWAFPEFHFEPGRTAKYTERWNRGVDKLKRANVYWSPWIWDVAVTDGLAHIGEALHSYHDGFTHTAKHHADTPWKHVTGPNSGKYKKATRFYKVGDSLSSRPDDPDLWPVDHAATVAGTRVVLQEIWKIRSVQCYCKKK
jgi:hypothetical protein